jgi:hypothetical protein
VSWFSLDKHDSGLIGGSDYKEGVNSFLEKRKANFLSDPHQKSPDDYPWWSEVDIRVEPHASKESKL